MTQNIKISIVIPTLNGASTLRRCLEGIRMQTMIDSTEVVLIDSGSTDNTLHIAGEYPFVCIHQIPQSDFGHGKTRNLGVSLAKGDFVVITVQDAYTTDQKWLEIMLQHFKDDAVAGVCGHQGVPNEKWANPLQWFRPVNKAEVSYSQLEDGEFNVLSKMEIRQYSAWDDVNAMYRKSILKIIPFEDVDFAEDMIWARTALQKGYKLVNDKNARVWHYHHYIDMGKLRNRIFFTVEGLNKYFGVVDPSPFSLVAFLKILYLCFRYRVAPIWWVYNIRLYIFSWRYTKLAIGKIKQ